MIESVPAGAVPVHVPGLEAPTLCKAFQATAAEYADLPALRFKDSGYECDWAEYAATVRRRAAAFAALGVGRGDTVGFMLVNRPALHLCDTAAMHLGAVCFSIYNTSSAEQIEYVIRDAANRVIVTEPQFLDGVLAARERVETLEHVIVIGESPEGTLSIADFEALAEDSFEFEAAWQAVEPDNLLCLIYTSGTTGPPKGVQLTHANLLADWRAVNEVRSVHPGVERTISYLPSAHLLDRWANLYAQMIFGGTVHCCPDPREFVFYSIEVKPTAWGSVPRIWEKLKAALEAGFAAEPDEQKRQSVAAALEIGLERAKAKQAGEVPAELEERWREADERVFSEVRERLGLSDCEWFAAGAAPTPPEVLLFFDAIGIEIDEVWGMSETSSIATMSPPGRTRIGTVGKPVPGIELEIAGDGEVRVRGPIVMQGYRNMPEQTAAALSEDGWLATGDVGEIDVDGYLKIVDRKKELIINAAGKNMSPANIEAKVKVACPLAAQVVAIGDRRPYNVALVVLDPDACAVFAAQHGLADASPVAMAREEVVREAVAEGVEAANRQLSRVEQVKRFELLAEEWEPGGEELTPTLKLKRKPIAEKYAAEIEALYGARPE